MIAVAALYNPFDGIKPSLGPFAPIFQSKIGTFIGLAWALAFVYVAYHLIEATARMGRARRTGYADVLDDAKRELGFSAVAVVTLAAIPALYGVLAA